MTQEAPPQQAPLPTTKGARPAGRALLPKVAPVAMVATVAWIQAALAVTHKSPWTPLKQAALWRHRCLVSRQLGEEGA